MHSRVLELDERLASDPERSDAAMQALELIGEGGSASVVVCASRPLIIDLLGALGIGRGDADSLRCQKGSVWLIDRHGSTVDRAAYLPPREHERTRRRAVLDVGSTSVSLLVADVGPEPDRIRSVLRLRAGLRLGASANRVSEVDGGRIVELGRSMRARAEEAGSSDLISVATASLRNATNGDEIAARLRGVLDPPIVVLSGREEAEVVYRAVHTRLDLGRRKALVLDLGGGSLELAVGRGDTIEYAASEPLGVARLHAEHAQDDPMTSAQVEALRARVRARLAPHVARIKGRKPPRCAVAGGGVRALARLMEVERGESQASAVRGLVIPRSQLEDLERVLRHATHGERVAMPGMQAERADLLPTAAIVLCEVMHRLELPALVVSDWGLREGLLIGPPRRLAAGGDECREPTPLRGA